MTQAGRRRSTFISELIDAPHNPFFLVFGTLAESTRFHQASGPQTETMIGESMKRPLACLIIAGTFTFGASMIASAAPSVPSSVQTSQSTVQKVRDDYTVCRHGYRHTRSGRRIACGHSYTSPGVTIRLGTGNRRNDHDHDRNRHDRYR
jgi:hypothetical protein